MIVSHVRQLASLEGHQVSVALRDGVRIDDCQLVSRGRRATSSLWLFADGADVFVPLEDVVDVWGVTEPTGTTQ